MVKERRLNLRGIGGNYEHRRARKEGWEGKRIQLKFN